MRRELADLQTRAKNFLVRKHTLFFEMLLGNISRTLAKTKGLLSIVHN